MMPRHHRTPVTWLDNPSEALVAFVPHVSIEDRPLLWTYLFMEARRLVTLLSWALALCGLIVKGGLLGGGLNTAPRPGLRC
jgi:hypothetical protein